MNEQELDANATLEHFVGKQEEQERETPTRTEQDKALLEAFTGQASSSPSSNEPDNGDDASESSPPLSDEENEEDEESNEEIDSRGQTRQVIENAIQRLRTATQQLGEGVASLPTPGSIAFLLFVILFLAIVIVPVNSNGDTRAKLIFYTLLNRTQLEGERNRETGSAAADQGQSALDTLANDAASAAQIPSDIASLFSGGFTR